MHRISLEILEKAQLPGDQAKAILEVMDLEFERQGQSLTTKDDLARLEGILRSSLGSLEAEIKLQFYEFRVEVKSEMTAFRSEMMERIHSVELQLQTQRAEMARWILGASGAMIGAFGVMLGLFYFFSNHVGR